MTKQQLEIFTLLSKNLNYTTTAEFFHLSQPTISYQIKKLEEELGFELFERNTRSVLLTPAGKSFHEDCRDIVSLLDRAITQSRIKARQFRANLSIGFSTHLCQVEPLLALCKEQMPDVLLNITISDPIDVITRLTRNDLSICLSHYSELALQNSHIHFEPMLKSRFVCVVRNDHALAQKTTVTFQDLEGEDLILFSAENKPNVMQSLQNQIRKILPQSVTYFSSSAPLSASMISAGIGITLMPDFACPDNPRLVKIPFQWDEPLILGVFWNDQNDSFLVQQFLNCARKVFNGDHLPEQ